jgi:hypothetical protein
MARGLQRTARQFAFVALVTGSSFHKVFMVCAFLGYESPAESTYYKAQRCD